MVREENYDVVIVGCGVGGLYTALNLPSEDRILMICKEDIESCDSMLAQGGICVLWDETDYDAYFEDTMRAGHYENRKESVDIMIRSSRDVINNLLKLGVGFDKNPDGSLKYTKEGAHSQPRICFHEDITGKEITTTLQTRVKELPNVEIREYTVMTDILVEKGICTGILVKNADGDILKIHAKDTVLATGGIGGLYKHSTNFPSLTGDGLDVAKKHGVRLEHLDYVQIHPTSLYSKKPGRSFLISESTRGEGAVLLNGKGERFVDELLPRDVVTQAIEKEMEKEGSDHVWLSFKAVPEETIRNHFPHIYEECLKNTISRRNRLRSYRRSIILWAVSMSIISPRRRWTTCMRLVRRAATAYTERTGLPATVCWKALYLQRERQARSPDGRTKSMNPITMQLVADEYIRMALKEDINSEDVSTNAVMPEYRKGEVQLLAKADGIIAGLQVFERVFKLLDEATEIKFEVKDGDTVTKGSF